VGPAAIERHAGFRQDAIGRVSAFGEVQIGRRVADLALAAFICVTSIEALTHTAVLHNEIVAVEAMEALIDDATRLVVGYLTS
jgi:hypothetical protein